MTEFQHGHALLVGVGNDLPVTEVDAGAVADVLRSSRAGYPADQVELVCGPKATRDGIRAAFDRLQARTAADPEATVFVYYSGHGQMLGNSENTARYHLVPYDFDWDRLAETTISDEELTERMRALRAKKLLLLLDCCHAAGLPKAKAAPAFAKSTLPPLLLKTLDAGAGQVVMASCQAQEVSYTGVPYSVFTACLLEALEGKAGVRGGSIRILDVLAHLFEEVPKRQPKQHPFLNRVEKLSHNFALCLAVGAKGGSAGGGVAASEPWAESVRQRQQEVFRKPLEILINNLGRYQARHATTASLPEKIDLEHRIEETEKEIRSYEKKLGLGDG